MRLFLLTIFFPCLSYSQSQERKILFYNIGFGAITSGIGAVINKPKKSDWKNYFLKGVWQGSIGGGLNYFGKKTIYLVNRNNDLVYSWPGKLLHHAGVSIIENSSNNQPFLKNWSFDLGPARFDFSFGDGHKFKVRFLPVSLYAVVSGFRDAKFDVATSLATGNLVFKANDSLLPGNSLGITYERGFSYVNNEDKHHSISHEIIHQFQYREYQIFNSWLKPFENKIQSKTLKKIFDKYIYFDIPYFLIPYSLEGRFNDFRYYRNFYEFEAERFATSQHVIIN